MENLKEVEVDMIRTREEGGDCCSFFRGKVDVRKSHRPGLCIVNIDQSLRTVINWKSSWILIWPASRNPMKRFHSLSGTAEWRGYSLMTLQRKEEQWSTKNGANRDGSVGDQPVQIMLDGLGHIWCTRIYSKSIVLSIIIIIASLHTILFSIALFKLIMCTT